MKKIAVYGAGGFGREVKMLIDQINHHHFQWEFIGFFDDNPKYADKNIHGYPVIGGKKILNEWKEELSLVLAIGEPNDKKTLINEIKNLKINYPVLIHPNALIGKENVNIGEGTIITAGNIITIDINIGKHVMINLDCTIGHDADIGDYSSIMPSVNISGNVILEECVYLGTGVQIINNCKIGQNSIIGAGGVVIKNIPPGCTAVGVPAKPVHRE